MRWTKERKLENESKLAFLELLKPVGWICRDKIPDVAIDLEVEIVEKEELTNKVLWFQLKATESTKRSNGIIPFSIGTKYLKHFEGCHLPVVILLWIKPENSFYHVFAQRYIVEQLSAENPRWRSQETVTIRFEPQSRLEKPETLDSIATGGQLYLIQQELYAKAQGRTTYWLDGIPKSDDKELKERTLKALQFMEAEKYSDAIEEFEQILRTCTVSPTERMSILLNLGNAYYLLGQIETALKNYEGVLKTAEKADKRDALEGKGNALGSIGFVYSDKGDLDKALKYLEAALAILDATGLTYGRDTILRAINPIKKV